MIKKLFVGDCFSPKLRSQCRLVALTLMLSSPLQPISKSHIEGPSVSFIAVFKVVLATSSGLMCTCMYCVCVCEAGPSWVPASPLCAPCAAAD